MAGQNRETDKKTKTTLRGCRGAGKAKSEDLWRECPSSFWGGGEKEAEREGMETRSELCNSAAASVMSAAASPTGGDAPLNGGEAWEGGRYSEAALLSAHILTETGCMCCRRLKNMRGNTTCLPGVENIYTKCWRSDTALGYSAGAFYSPSSAGHFVFL